MSLHARMLLQQRHPSSAVYALLALLAYELPVSAELAALRHSRAIVWC